ncbi:MAG: hypothetical protein QOG99_2861, partial [Frankiales bacterium]|nr:hypothetical protein [Frankiales bacterium]
MTWTVTKKRLLSSGQRSASPQLLRVALMPLVPVRTALKSR